MPHGKRTSPDGETATVDELAASYGITPKSMRRFLHFAGLAPVGHILTLRRRGRRRVQVYRVTDIHRVRDGRSMTKADNGLRQAPTAATMARLTWAMLGW